MPEIIAFFSKWREPLQKAALEALEAAKPPRRTIPRNCTSMLRTFSGELFKLQDGVVERIECFTSDEAESIQIEFEDLQDQITLWFDEVASYKRRRIDDLSEMCLSSKKQIVRKMLSGQLKTP